MGSHCGFLWPRLPATNVFLVASSNDDLNAATASRPDGVVVTSPTSPAIPSSNPSESDTYAIGLRLALGLDVRTVPSITCHRTVSLLLTTYASTTDVRSTVAIFALASALDVLTFAPKSLMGL